MSCTTLLVGAGATNDGSTIIARNEDCENGTFNAKSMVVVLPEDQPRTYTGVNSHLTIELPNNPLRYCCTPNTDSSDGVWGEAGINAANVSMSATETISANELVLGADPLVAYKPAKGHKGTKSYEPEQPGGIGEEDLVTIILPYIKSARDGVKRMGALLEQYGTYETNGVAFGDEKEVWYIENIGGHHWIARRVPDNCYVAQPNRQGIDTFDLADALGPQKDHMCSKDLATWMAANHLCADITTPPRAKKIEGVPAIFNAREAFSSHTWLDIVYNAPRKWWLCKTLSGSDPRFAGEAPEFGPESLDIPWAMVPDAKISAADVKNLLSTTYDGTEYNCYGTQGTPHTRHLYRNIGINRTCECSVLNIRPYAPKPARAVQWVALGSGPFNTAVAIFTNVSKLPDYFDTGLAVSTDKLYWQNRLIAALADPEFWQNYESIESYQQTTMAAGYVSLRKTDAALKGVFAAKAEAVLEAANEELTDFVHAQTNDLLASVLFTRSLHMANAFGSNDH